MFIKRYRNIRYNEEIYICEDLEIKYDKSRPEMVRLCINSINITDAICKHLKIEKKKKSDIVSFPELSSGMLNWSFIRGFFDGDGHVAKISENYRVPRCGISTTSKNMREGILKICKIKCSETGITLEFNGRNALDFYH